MSELNGEKIDIIDWSEDPGDVRRQRPLAVEGGFGHRARPPSRTARVVVPDFQLSLAIGKEGPERAVGRPAHRVAHRHPQRRRPALDVGAPESESVG
jgi:hypothetical protein